MADLVNVATGGKIIGTVDLSGAEAGPWSVSVENTDGQEAVLPSAFTVANPPPSLTGITPGTGVIGETLPATIEGTGFFPGCVASLGMMGEPDIPLTITQTEPAELTCSINLSGAPPGLWNLEVENPEGQGVILYDAFFSQYPAPTVTCLSPDRYDNGGITGIMVLKGTEFFDGAEVNAW